MDEKCRVSVYLDTGAVAEWDVDDAIKGREFASEIVARGCRIHEGKNMVWFPPHRIRKVKVSGASGTSHYPTQMRAT